MQILKPLLIVCVAVCTLSVRGADNARQAQAREALQKLQGVTNQPVQAQPLQPQPEQPAPPPPAPPPTQPTTPPAAQPLPLPPITAPPEGNPPQTDPEVIAKAREALRLKMQEVQPQPPGTLQPASPAPPPPTPTVPPSPKPIRQRKLHTPVPPPPPAVPPSVQAEPAATAPVDPAAIAKAREAMRLKMQDVVAQEPPEPTPVPMPAPAPVAANPAPVVTQTPSPTPEPPPTPTSAPPPPPVVSTPAIQPPVQPALPMAEEADPAAIAKAREALRLKMQELHAEQPEARTLTPPPAPAVAQTSPPTAAVTRPPPATPPPPITAQPLPSPLTTTPATTPPPPLPNAAEEVGADPATIEKAREAVRMKMQTLPVPVDETQAGQTAGYLHRPERVTAPGNFPPLAGPALPISAAKQQQLDALLLKYKADQITPEQYHAERAKILGEQ